MANINSKNVSKAEEALQLANKDLIAFGKLFLPDDFLRSETPFFHYEVADAVMDYDVRQLAVVLPRGHGKTVLTKANILHDFVFAKEPLFYGWVAASSKISVPNLDYVKYHLEYNDSVRYYFGDLKGRKWTEDDIELSNGCKLISKSNLSGIRGGAKLHKRYDLIVLDDFEDENNTITPEARSKISNLVTAVVFPALEPKTGRLRINGTPVHYDAFIQNILVGYQKAKKEDKKFDKEQKRMDLKKENEPAPPQEKFNPTGRPEDGRPKNAKDKEKRKQKEVKPRQSVSSEFVNISLWATKAQGQISEVINPAILSHFGKGSLRSLTKSETEQLEHLKLCILCNMEPFIEITPDVISDLLKRPISVASGTVSLLAKLKEDFLGRNGREPNIDEVRQINVSSYALSKTG